MKKYDYLIVGAGLFGCVFAHKATQQGKKCLVIDKRNHIGGNCYTEEIENIHVHKYGAHIFRTSKKPIWEYVNQFAEFNHFVNSPIANYKGRILNMPFNMNTFSRLWGIRTPDEAKKIIEEQRKEIKGEPRNLEEKIISLVGRDIYELLVKGYTEKQWGRPCNELPESIISRLPVRFTYDNNYYNDRYQGIPIGGYTRIFSQMLSDSDVELNVDYLENKDKYLSIAEKIIFTGSIDSYYNFVYGPLEYRSLRFEHEIIDKDNYQGVAVVNYTDAETPYTRIIEHKHFDFGTQPKTVISREYSMEWHMGLEPFYPINDEKNQLNYEKYLLLSKQEKNVIFAGRLGSYSYYDMQDTIQAAIDLANKELHCQY